MLVAAARGREPAAPASARMDGLLALYRDWGLPLPPETAPLVQTPTGGFRLVAPGRTVPIFTLGFLLKPAVGKTPAEVLAGPLRLECEPSEGDGKPTPVVPGRVAVAKLSFGSENSTFPLDTALATALQCHARGYRRLADDLLRRALRVRGGGQGPSAVSSGGAWMPHRRSLGYAGEPGDDARTILAGMAWTYWMNDLVRPGSDWGTVAAMMRKIVAAVPALDDEPRRRVRQSLEAALVPGTAEAGSVEADINELVNCTQTAGGMVPDREPDARFQRLLRRGFEAVPALIDHLDDDRLSRSLVVGFNNFPTMPRRVGEIVADLLQAIAGEELSRDWLRIQLGAGLDRTTALAWWAKAAAAGEEATLCERVLPSGPNEDTPHAGQLAIITARYPQRLPELYREVLDRRPEVSSGPLAEAISGSALPPETRLELLHRGVAHRTLAHRQPAVRELRKLDAAAADAAVLDVLAKLPPKPTGAVWTSDEANVVFLVLGTTSPAVWDALLAAAKRAHVSLRMELMNPMSYPPFDGEQRQRRLGFLARFLDDDTLRNAAADRALYDGPCAAFTFPRITVRDFAAMQIAHILGFPDNPQPDWSPKQWAALRVKATAAVARGF